MNILGWTIALTPRITHERQRTNRNQAAMTSNVGMSALPGETVASRIHRQEIELAERVLRAAEDRQSARELYCQEVHECRPNQVSATLRQRLGGAHAVEADPQFAPILVEEIELLEQAVADLAEDGLVSSRSLALAGRDLLEDLHLRLGHAEAVRYLGTVAVFGSHAQTEIA
jgi:hypothetical protein